MIETVTPGAPLIELENITKTYRNGAMAVEVLHGVSLTIHRGEFVAIMGTSGSGKSTLMNLIGCLDRPTSGRYLFAGRDVSGLGRDALALLRRDAFGFVFQQYNLLPSADAVENVEVPAIYAGLRRADRHARAREILTALGLGERMHHRPGQLSGGQQQRVSIARALMNGGSVILADEPTGALDSHSGAEVMTLLRRLNAEGHTVVLITHEAAIAAEAKRMITIADGVVLSDSGPQQDYPAPTHGEARIFTAKARPTAGRLNDAAEAVKMAFRSLRANLFRTVLTLLGIIIGVGSVVAMLAIGDGAKQDVLTRIQAMGTNLLLIRPGAPNTRGGSDVATLVPEDAEAIARLPNVASAVPEMAGGVTIRAGNVDDQTSVTATTADFPQARDWPLQRGVFFGPDDVKSYAPVTVLGQTVVDALFPSGVNPVGSYVLIKNVPFQVIGVMASKGATPFGSDMDDVAFVPLTTGGLRLFGKRYLRSIIVQVTALDGMKTTQKQVEDLLTARHHTTDFRVRNMASIVATVTATQNTLTVLLGSIAAISLLVGGIGVMNIMLVSVTERTREIGIRMATGARGANIRLQFLTEALVVCAIGGGLGVGGGLGTALMVGRLGSPIVLSLPPVLLAFGCALATGLVFGTTPARKAANLDPVVALSAE
ncbi:MacB family efflux pump subunit [Varunaivibrio sulfuroxidans]|uniref:Pyoverdine export ATP-binding/permease protein PvdT n=1 Tax=Varunaivibrio sulfuroxidans TaxID=1773489 RepID=A0A4R3JIR4_9PROT|nr:MacB family efflux pump subunit [Varunaivibrio sulfuroxidans]TCS65176.1 macrolide transport system ATP-binding/permease protein [Varunaivibrio sulfuroxidans]WES29542.1 MacB family efflux pump subunit [Varunaivibrio sulfuroxidans]